MCSDIIWCHNTVYVCVVLNFFFHAHFHAILPNLIEEGEQGNAVGQGNFIIADSAHPLLPQKLAKSAIWETQDNTGLTGDCRVLGKLLKLW